MDAIHIMRPGSHTSSSGASVSFSSGDLAAIAAVYNPKTHEAPIVVGHPQADSPAYGWVDRLEARSDGLYAIPKQVNTEFADIVRQGAYKKVSGSLYRPEAKNHPVPGKWYLRHVGFLGAQPPAVKGLRPIDLADGEEGFIDFEESKIDLREHRLAVRERELVRADNRSFVDQMSRKGVLPFSLKEEAEAFLETLCEDTVFDFADGSGEDVKGGQVQWFKKFLSLLPVPVATGELAVGEFSNPPEFSAPKNYKVDAASAEIHRNAVAYQHKAGCSYADAVRYVTR